MISRLLNYKTLRVVIYVSAFVTALSVFLRRPDKTTNWIGSPVVSDNHQYTPSQGWIANVEIGLRSDGVVVWRKREAKP